MRQASTTARARSTEGTTTRRRAGRTPSADVEGVLLQAAVQLLAEQGADGVTVRSVAARAGVAPAGVYSRFDGKSGLLDAILIQGFRQLREALVSARGSSAGARLRSVCVAYRDFALRQPHHYRLMFEHKSPEGRSDEAMQAARDAFDELIGRLADAADAGEIHVDDPVERAQQTWSALHGAVNLELNQIGFTPDPGETFLGLVQTLVAGLAHPIAEQAIPQPEDQRAASTLSDRRSGRR